MQHIKNDSNAPQSSSLGPAIDRHVVDGAIEDRSCRSSPPPAPVPPSRPVPSATTTVAAAAAAEAMNRLRTTFKRSRTPTGAEMKTQSSLEVPKQVRSASFDEIQVEAKRQQQQLHQQLQQQVDETGLLRVPQYPGQRSRSVDSANSSDEGGNFLEVPRRFQRRRSSGSKTPYCVHCVCLEEFNRIRAACASIERPPPEPPDKGSSISISDETSSSYESDDDEVPEQSETRPEPVPECSITVTLTPTVSQPPLQSPPPKATSPTIECFPPQDELAEEPPTPTRRKSVVRQEAFFAEPTGTSLENMSQSDGASEGALSEGDPVTIPESGLVVRDIYLQVPDLRRDRAASVDSCFSKVSQGKTEELQHSGVSLEVPVGPNVALRSRSVDIVLPTNEQARYKALAMAAPPGSAAASYRGKSGTAAAGSPGGVAESGERSIRSTPDWSETAINGDHLWLPTSVSGDFCYVGDTDCTKHGPRLKCAACNVVAHQTCIGQLVDKIKFTCKSTFRDVGVRQYREQTCIHHHWVHRRSEKGKCRQCGKSFQSKLSFSNKEIVALSCSWCKAAYHNKETCFNIQRIGEECRLGVHSAIIVPPSWIVKLPRKGSFKSSLRKSPKKRPASKRRSKDKEKDSNRTFVLKPIPSTTVRPVIVFINPKSGGNQGAKLLQKFQWLLNPRQVFDLTQGGPKMGLEMFRNVPNLRVLACGGDGTVGWILSVIDQIGMSPAPAVGVLPLGTGNDLARALGWGGGYTDEPISKILSNIGSSDTLLLDRWSLEVEKNPDGDPSDGGKESLPLNVVNNYFSMGVDAHIALEFHEAREAHPERFNSRLRNKVFYGQMGGKDLLKRKWKGLAELVTLECDGKDLTPKLKELKVHAVVLLNIPSYGGGTHPWNRSMGSVEPSTEDGLIEVVGLTTYQLPLLQAGGHGTCITQCRHAKIVTSKTIPMQVDGEACKLAPSVIKLSLLNQATMLTKSKGRRSNIVPDQLSPITYQVYKISMSDYEQHHYDRELLSQAAEPLGQVEVNPVSDLEQVRNQINSHLAISPPTPSTAGPPTIDQQLQWCFVDSCTAERFFRIDRAQETLHYISDIAADILYLLLEDADSSGAAGKRAGEDVGAQGEKEHSGTAGEYIVPEMKVSDEGSLDSPSDHPPMSPKVVQSPDEDDPNLRNGGRPPHIPGLKIRSSPNDKPSDTLLKAAKIGDLPMIRELHSQGYSLLSKDAQGQTILHIAARFDHRDVVKYLLSQAPSVLIDMRDSVLGQTALHKAAQYKCRLVCYMLVAGGASLGIADYQGLTPRLLARQVEDEELAAYLEGQEQFQQESADYGTIV